MKPSHGFSLFYSHLLATALICFTCAIVWREPSKFEIGLGFIASFLFAQAVGHGLYVRRDARRSPDDGRGRGCGADASRGDAPK